MEETGAGAAVFSWGMTPTGGIKQEILFTAENAEKT